MRLKGVPKIPKALTKSKADYNVAKKKAQHITSPNSMVTGILYK